MLDRWPGHICFMCSSISSPSLIFFGQNLHCTMFGFNFTFESLSFSVVFSLLVLSLSIVPFSGISIFMFFLSLIAHVMQFSFIHLVFFSSSVCLFSSGFVSCFLLISFSTSLLFFVSTSSFFDWIFSLNDLITFSFFAFSFSTSMSFLF